MHEVSLIHNTLTIAEEEARSHGATRIHRIVLRIGPLACVDPDALRFAFEVAREGTMADEAVLDIKLEPVVCHCELCDSEFTAEGQIYSCPSCQTISRCVRSGMELELLSLEATCDD
jgi:hydrogenase nickel incorporation protein HypA/HybF